MNSEGKSKENRFCFPKNYCVCQPNKSLFAAKRKVYKISVEKQDEDFVEFHEQAATFLLFINMIFTTCWHYLIG